MPSALQLNDVATVIERFSPRSTDAYAAAFAKAVVAKAAPYTPGRAKALLFAASRLAAFGESVGLELAEEVLLSPSVIERCCMPSVTVMSAPTRRTVRSNLRALSRVVLPQAPSPSALSRERAKAPYSDAEIAGYLALSDAQSTAARRMRLGALVCLGAGAGLMGAELRHVTGHDVCRRSGGVVVTVEHGRRPRVVPVLSRYHDRLLAAGDFAAAHYVIGGINPARENVTDRLVRVALSTSNLPRLDTGRLRSTWLVAMAEAIGLRAFMDAAGITCSQRLGDLVGHLDPPGEEEAVALLGGRR